MAFNKTYFSSVGRETSQKAQIPRQTPNSLQNPITSRYETCGYFKLTLIFCSMSAGN